jgi:hypothetical protein
MYSNYKIGQAKRLKSIFVVLTLTVSIFFIKLLNVASSNVGYIFLVALSAGLFTFFGALWVEGFNVKRESVYGEILQVSWFVFSEVLFIQMFFFAGLDRLYEALLLFIILVLFFLSTYGMFLVMNIFVVSRFRVIPLLSVAKTTMYAFSILGVFYIAYSLLLSSINPFVSILGILTLNYPLILTGFINIGLIDKDMKALMGDALILDYLIILPMFPAMLWNPFPEFIALVPSVLFFIIFGIIMHRFHGVEEKTPYFSYILSFIIILYLIVIYR